MDGDGDLDAFLGVLGQDRLFRNDGTGVFADSTAMDLPVLSDDTLALDLGDVDGDGDLDAVLGNCCYPLATAQDRLLLNDGTGHFVEATAAGLPAALDDTYALALGDVDGDGDLDLLVGIPAQNRLRLNDGAGVFTDATATNLPAVGFADARALAFEDVDGDADLDAFLGNFGGYSFSGLGTPDAQNRLYLNDGAGVFSDVTGTHASPSSSAAAMGDVDGDGDLDVVLGRRGGGQDGLFLNDGDGNLTDATATHLPVLASEARDLALGDLDGDGDLEAYAAGFPDRLYFNRNRHLTWRAIPRVGKPLTFEITGPAGGLWLLAASLGSAGLPIPPVGTLRLDPSTAILAGLGPLDSQGAATATFAVPASPVLVGVATYWQAIVAFPPRFTNLEVATATNL